MACVLVAVLLGAFAGVLVSAIVAGGSRRRSSAPAVPVSVSKSEVLLPFELERGAVAYEAYRRAAAGRSLVTGDRLQDWSELADVCQRAWVAVAEEVCRRYGAIY